MPRLFMHYLKCDKTTELNADEVYFVIGTKHSGGAVSTYKLPAEGKPWNMNDGSHANTRIDNIEIANFELLPGEHIDILFNLNEEDGGVANDYLKTIALSLESSGNPYATAAGAFVKTIASLFTFEDSDDWMGSFMVRVTRNEGGDYISEWRIIDRIFVMDAAGKGPNYRAINFRGDGSDYTAHFEIQ